MAFVPRLNRNGMVNNPFWYSDNPFYTTGDNGLPNCTCYAWGRFWEEGEPQTRPNLSLGNAQDWYGNTGDGYERGSTPKLGAILCFSGGGGVGVGHVCVVEQINSDGSIVTSNSAYTRNPDYMDSYYFYLETRQPPNYDPSGTYGFQGFIYNPNVTGGVVPPEPSNWITGNRILDRQEMDNNAIKFYYKMTRLGVSYNAIIGMLANIQLESWINPGVWENFDPYNGGYGLVQWTPYTKYSNWAGSGWENNGDKECERIYYESQNGLQWFDNPYAYLIDLPTTPPISFSEFINSNLDYVTLADYWLLYYEHPSELYIVDRHNEHQNICNYYNNLLGGGSPPTPPIIKKTLMLYVNKRKFMRKRGLIWR